MDFKKEFEKILKKEARIALASSVADIPNVRIVNFVYLSDEKTLYFISDKGDPKEKEFEKNEKAAFTTIPSKGLAHIRVHYAAVKKSGKTVFDVKDDFAAKMPWFKENIEQHGESLCLYEVSFSKAMVLAGPEKAEEIEI